MGNFPPLWSEWNGRYRDTVRDFWRGSPGYLGDLAERLCGSSDLYQDDGRSPHASINFVTCHDGFTLTDLVSYNDKHNEANGEDNRDGTTDNRSWNCGAEGPTDDVDVLELRARQRRNLVTTLLLSQGVPMIWSGDELGHTQHGMNNAYAQDNEISWIDWSSIDDDLLGFWRQVCAFRQAHPVLRRRRFLEGRPTGPGDRDDIAWLSPSGERMTVEAWREEQSRAFACYLNGNAIIEPDSGGDRIVDDSLLVMLNGEPDPLDFTFPVGEWPANWLQVLDTSKGQIEPLHNYRAGDRLTVEGRSILVLVSAG